MNEIEKLGFDNWFRDKVDLSKTDSFKIVRVISVSKNSFVVSNGVKDIYAELTGKVKINASNLLTISSVSVFGLLFNTSNQFIFLVKNI